MANDVTATFAGTVLTLAGDASNNSVEISMGSQPGEFVIKGADGSGTTINGSPAGLTTTTPFSTLNVTLGVGSDTLTVTGPATNMTIAGTVNINNDSGTDMTTFTNVLIGTNLNVTKVANGEGIFMMHNSKVAGNVTFAHGGFNGDNTIVIDSASEVQGNLAVNNLAGEASFVSQNATFFGNVTIANAGPGDTTTQIGMPTTNQVAVWGAFSVTNGIGYDKVFLNTATLWQGATVTNGNGNTIVSVESSEIGKGNVASDLNVTNSVGFDTFSYKASSTRRDINIANGAAADLFGGKAELLGMTTGKVGRDFNYVGENGPDMVTVDSGMVIGRNANLTLGDSNNIVLLMASTIQGNLTITGGLNRDEVTLSGGSGTMKIDGNATINLNAGIDMLSLLVGTELNGATNVNGGGAEIDTLRITVTPAAPLTITSFENQIFA